MPDLLACPECSGPLKSEGTQLRCGCSTWPVVGGIPILARWAKNRTFELEEVLAGHLPPPDGLVSKILRRFFPGIPAIHKAITNRDATFIDLAAALGRTRDLDYFRYRFNDLSYLSSAALLTPLSRGPVLDLGCGAGHLLHALSRRLPKAVLVGLDLHFSLLYLAKRFLSPGSLLVCADASVRLPFVDGAFEASVCADTFKYLSDRAVAARELLRVTKGPVVLSHFYDPAFQGEGVATPLTPDAALALFSSRSPRLHQDDELLKAFLERRELDLNLPPATQAHAASLTAGLESRVHSGADYFVSGSSLNPIYESVEEGQTLHLKRRFISERYSEAWRKYGAFLPEQLDVTQEQIAARDPELVRKFVLLDLPPLYC